MCTRKDLDYITQTVKDSALNMFADKLDKVILFGSYARDDYDSESDVDIMLLLDITAQSINNYFADIVKLSSRLSLENTNCTTISILMQDKDTFYKNETVLPFFRNISKEGVVIYAA
jgi:predicted nucleotidyltransferase